MTEQLVQTLTSTQQMDSHNTMDVWTLAKKRANAYLKLHGLLDYERERLLARITFRLAQTNIFSEQELIQLYISTAREELALLQNGRDPSCCQCKKPAGAAQAVEDDASGKPELRTQTGPRFERSSIRVAPLQAISLLPSRQRSVRHSH